MARILFRNCRVWDGSGAAAYPADVLVGDERIRAVARERG
jgi:N-acyl-D-aspartate/D-glutamate deacylase